MAALVAVAATESVMVLASTMLATVAPEGMPGPCTGWPTKSPELLKTRAVTLAEVVEVMSERSVRAANVWEVVVLVAPVIFAERVTSPVL